MFYFVSSYTQRIVNGLAFVDGKVPLIPANCLVAYVRQLVGTWVTQRLGPFMGAHLYTASHGAQLLGGCPINRALQEPTGDLLSKLTFPADPKCGWLRTEPSSSAPPLPSLSDPHQDTSVSNHKESNLSGARGSKSYH